jgi:hypothetical protein
MVDNYIKFEEPEGHVAWSGWEPDISKDCEDVGDTGDMGAVFDDAQEVSGNTMCVIFY